MTQIESFRLGGVGRATQWYVVINIFVYFGFSWEIWMFYVCPNFVNFCCEFCVWLDILWKFNDTMCWSYFVTSGLLMYDQIWICVDLNLSRFGLPVYVQIWILVYLCISKFIKWCKCMPRFGCVCPDLM